MQLLKHLFGIIIHLDFICVVIVLLCGIISIHKSRKKGHKLLISSIVVFFIIHLSPVSRIMLYQLEHRFPQEIDLPSDAKGLILLGGNFSLLESQSNGRPVYNLAAGRVIEFISLARRYPNLPIVFTGTPIEVELTKKLFDEMGIDPARVTYESESRNTLVMQAIVTNLFSQNQKTNGFWLHQRFIYQDQWDYLKEQGGM